MNTSGWKPKSNRMRNAYAYTFSNCWRFSAELKAHTNSDSAPNYATHIPTTTKIQKKSKKK